MSDDSRKEEKTRRERLRQAVHQRSSRAGRTPVFDTSDVLQEASLQLWQNGLDSFEDEYSSVDQALIATIAKGHLAKHYRMHAAQKRDVARTNLIHEDLPSQELEPIEHLANEEGKQGLLAAINQLQGESYRVIYRHKICNVTLKQLALEESVSIQQLRTKIEKAKRQLEELLNKQNGTA